MQSRRGIVKPHSARSADSQAAAAPDRNLGEDTSPQQDFEPSVGSDHASVPVSPAAGQSGLANTRSRAAAAASSRRTRGGRPSVGEESVTTAKAARARGAKRWSTGGVKSYFAGVDKARVRHFGLSVIGADGSVVLTAIVLALLGIVVAGAGIAVLPASIASIWMLFNLGGIGYNGTSLTLLPALPAIAMVAFIAWRVRREVAERVSIRDVRALVGTYLVVPLVLTVIAWLMLVDASNVFQRIKVPNLAIALASTLALHATAVVIGMGQRLIRALLRRRAWPEWLILSARLASRYLLWLIVAGLVVSLISMGWHFDTFRQAYAPAESFGDKVLLTLLSIGYLPNIALGAAGVIVGAPVTMGPAEVTLFTVTPGVLPPLPVLAAMPQSHSSMVFGALLVVPVIIAVWSVLRMLRTVRIDRPYVVVVTAAALAAVFTALLVFLLSGEVGIYGWVGPSWWLTVLLVSVWLAAPGAIVVAAVTGLPTSAASEDAESEATSHTPDSEDAVGAEETTAEEPAAEEPDDKVQETDAEESESAAEEHAEEQAEDAETEEAESKGDAESEDDAKPEEASESDAAEEEPAEDATEEKP